MGLDGPGAALTFWLGKGVGRISPEGRRELASEESATTREKWCVQVSVSSSEVAVMLDKAL